MADLLTFDQEQAIFKAIEKDTNSAFNILKNNNLPIPKSRNRHDLINHTKTLKEMSLKIYKEKQECLKKGVPLPSSSIHNAILLAINHLEAAIANKDLIFHANDGLVRKIAKSFNNRQQHMDDMQQESYIGLLRAIDKFDYRLGLKFSTYSFLWIKQGPMRYLAENLRTIRLPCYISEWRSKMSKMSERFMSEHGRLPSKEEVIAELEITEKQLEQFEEAMRNEVCLNIETDSENSKVKKDLSMIKKVHTNLLEQYSPENIHTKLEIENIDVIMRDHLHPMEEMVIRLRYGIVPYSDKDFVDSCDGMTYLRISQKIGTCVESIRKTEKRAIKKIKERISKS